MRSYVREMMTRSYADAALLPVIEDNCPACFKVSDSGSCLLPLESAIPIYLYVVNVRLRLQRSANASNFYLLRRSSFSPMFTGTCFRYTQLI